MILVTALLLGITLASAGLIAKNINSGFGTAIANRRIQSYLTWLGSLSNLILPIIFIALASLIQGAVGGGLTALGIIAGALGLGALRLPYSFRLLLAVFGVPVATILFLISLTI